MKSSSCRAVVTLAFMLSASAAQAAIVSYGSRAAFDAAFPGAAVEGWDGYGTGTIFPNGSSSAGIAYNSSSGDAIVTAVFLPSTPPNGLGNTTLGYFGSSDTMTFTFASPVSAFGIDINTFATADGAYSATTSLADIVDSVFDPFGGGGTGQFVGFSSNLPFTSVTIAPTAGFSYTLDTLRDVPLPEPGSLSLLATCLAGLFAGRKRMTA